MNPNDAYLTETRIDKAMELRAARHTWQEVADGAGYSSKGAAFNAVMSRVRARSNKHATQLREEQNEEIRAIKEVLMPMVLDDHDLSAANTLLRYLGRFADLNGLDAPKQVQVSAGVMAEMEQAFGELRLVVMGEVVPDESDEMDALEG